MRQKGVMKFIQGHRAGKWQMQDLNPGVLASASMYLILLSAPVPELVYFISYLTNYIEVH